MFVLIAYYSWTQFTKHIAAQTRIYVTISLSILVRYPSLHARVPARVHGGASLLNVRYTTGGFRVR